MKKQFFVTAALCATGILSSFGWGQKGHDVTAAIAEAHLTAEAQAMVNDLLDGKSIIYWANWLDNASNTPEYRYTKTWHYKNINEGVPYEAMGLNPSGDVVRAIRTQYQALIDPEQSKEEKALALKILVHLVGDMHQPMHMGHATDLGGNTIKLKYFDRDTNLHSIWDGSLVDSAHKWSYTEWVNQLDRLSDDEQTALVFPEGSPLQGVYTPDLIDVWAKETVVIADEVYKKMPEKSKISYNEIAWSAPIIEQQLLTGGLRLAFLLNDIATQISAQQ
ncbi:MAG: S1/P1 nuclease [Muribaculaceae bacterium]|nr:S1/P1 nuclease [Muribaculaceae bacterium]